MGQGAGLEAMGVLAECWRGIIGRVAGGNGMAIGGPESAAGAVWAAGRGVGSGPNSKTPQE